MNDVVCISPIDGREVARRTPTDKAAIEATLRAARRAQFEWSQTSIAARGQLLLRALEALGAKNDDVVQELALQMGRPVRYGGEFSGVDERVRHMIAIAEETLAPVVPQPKSGFRRYVRRQPLGVVLTIAPWNYPYLTAVNSVFPSLMAGNSVLFKAASQTILTGERLQHAFDTAGLPSGLFQNLVLSHQATAEIISSSHVDHVCFTGSVEGGRAIERAAAGTFTSLGLELGGKDPAYVRADADLQSAVVDLVDGTFFNSGQSCCGIERIYVADSAYDAFLESFIEQTNNFVLGDPMDTSVTLGPMAAVRFADHVRAQISQATSQCATAHIDAARFERSRPGTAYLAPQVLTNVTHAMDVMSEESFGPVVGIMKVGSDDDAVKLMNDSRYGLTASIWTTDLNAAEHIGSRIKAGTVFANRCDYLDPGLAWTGVKETGRGTTLSQIGYEMLTRPMSFHLKEI